MGWVIGSAIAVLLAIWLCKKFGNPRSYVRSLLFHLVVGYRMLKEDKPSATEEELAWEIVRLRIANPAGSRGLDEDEARLYINESPNIVDVLCSFCIRDMLQMGYPEDVFEVAGEAVMFLSKAGLEGEVKASKIYQNVKESSYDFPRMIVSLYAKSRFTRL